LILGLVVVVAAAAIKVTEAIVTAKGSFIAITIATTEVISAATSAIPQCPTIITLDSTLKKVRMSLQQINSYNYSFSLFYWKLIRLYHCCY